MQIYNCRGFKVVLEPVGSSWTIKRSGDVPRNVIKGLAELENAKPRPDLVVAHTIIKSILGKQLDYVKVG